MAFTATCIFEADVANGASTNGGGFDPGNANMAADLAATLGTGTAPVVTSASYNFAATDVGHHVFIKSGTNWTPGWYPITSVTSNAATLNAAIGAVRRLEPASSSYNTVTGCATTASPTAGTWTVDYSQGEAPYSYTDMVIGGTTTQFTSVGHPVGKNLVANMISVNGGTGFTIQRVLVSSTSGTTATCDKSLGTTASTGGNGTPGGALDHPAIVYGLSLINGITVFVKYSATPYLFGSSNNVSGGRISLSSGIGGLPMQGYDTTRTLNNTDTNRPILRANAATSTMYSIVNNAILVNNFVFDNPSALASVQGLHCSSGQGSKVFNCKFDGMTTTSVDSSAQSLTLSDCEITNSTSGNPMLSFGGISTLERVVIHDCPGGGAAISGQVNMMDCIVYNVGGIGVTLTANLGIGVRRCTIHTTVGHGIVGVNLTEIADTIVWAAGSTGTAYGVQLAAASDYIQVTRAHIGNSRTADWNPLLRADQMIGYVHLTTDPCTNAAGGDFSLNNNSGGGASCRGQTLVLPGGTTTNYPDAGAVQHSDASVAAGPTYSSY